MSRTRTGLEGTGDGLLVISALKGQDPRSDCCCKRLKTKCKAVSKHLRLRAKARCLSPSIVFSVSLLVLLPFNYLEEQTRLVSLVLLFECLYFGLVDRIVAAAFPVRFSTSLKLASGLTYNQPCYWGPFSESFVHTGNVNAHERTDGEFSEASGQTDQVFSFYMFFGTRPPRRYDFIPIDHAYLAKRAALVGNADAPTFAVTSTPDDGTDNESDSGEYFVLGVPVQKHWSKWVQVVRWFRCGVLLLIASLLVAVLYSDLNTPSIGTWDSDLFWATFLAIVNVVVVVLSFRRIELLQLKNLAWH